MRDYKNFIKQQTDFWQKVIEDLINTSSNYFDVQRYGILLFGEMKVKANLVFEKYTVDDDFLTLGREADPATHALAFQGRIQTKN